VMRRLQANLWKNGIELANIFNLASDVPAPEGHDGMAMKLQPATVLSQPGDAPINVGEERVVPDAIISHPLIAGRMYATAKPFGLLRSDDGGKQWRAGLAPLHAVGGTTLWFTLGDKPLLGIIGQTTWLFHDSEDAFFP
jgi:hypothetical protein